LLLTVAAKDDGAGGGAVGEKIPTTVLLGDLFGDTANAWIVTDVVPVGPGIGVEYLFELVVGTVPSAM
jgi:hypothetical protein